MRPEILPPDEVLKRFWVEVVDVLGGRLNQHWLVERGHERFVLRRWAPIWAETMEYELRLLAKLVELGWPVANAVAEPVEWEGVTWSLLRFLQGAPDSREDPVREQRNRGRLLAQLQGDMKGLEGFGQRGAWRRCEEILEDTALDALLSEHETTHREEIGVVRWHLERARARVGGLDLRNWPGQVIHGDFTTWNLLFSNGRLSGVLDFELSHFDHRVGDFALAWRGKYDELITGYEEITPLLPQEKELLTPMWWAFLIEEACGALRRGEGADEWSIDKLLQRSPLMGADAGEYSLPN